LNEKIKDATCPALFFQPREEAISRVELQWKRQVVFSNPDGMEKQMRLSALMIASWHIG
jgi:hypothetical protein